MTYTELVQKIRDYTEVTSTVLTDTIVNGIIQDETKSTFFKRRKPHESEIKIDELTSLSAEKIYQKICALEDPYPNAYIKTIDNKKILLKFVEIE